MIFTTGFSINFKSLLFIALFAPILLTAQIYEEAVGMGGIYDDKANSIALDADKNVYMAGAYTDSVDFDPSGNLSYHTTVAAPNAFLAKYNSTGSYLWSVSVEGSQPIEIRDIAISNSGHVYVVGDFMGTASFNTTTSYTASGVFDVFIAKYDTSGNLIWARTFGGPAPDWAYSLALDTNENIVATGTFTAFADFDASTSSFPINSIGGSPDIFLVKYDSSGNFVWAKNAGGNSMDEGHSVETDALNNIYLTGWFLSGTADFDGNTVNAIGGRDIFIAKYDNNGNGIWAHGMGGATDDEGTAILLKNNNLFLSGTFQTNANIDPTQAAAQHTSNGSDDVFLAKFDTAGNYVWSTSIGGPMEEWSSEIGLDDDKNIYLTGFYSSAADFSTGFSNISIISNGDKDIFVAKYDSNGSVISAMGIGDIGEDISNAFAINDEHFYIAGSFSDAVDFNPSQTATNTISSPAGKSIFQAKYSFCRNNYEIAYDTICAGDTYIVDPNNSFSQSGSYRVNFSSTSNVCDSILTLHLSVTSMNLNINQNNNDLSSHEKQASYQWLDCTADTIIPGADSAHFIAPYSGNYAVILQKNNCVDTSACINVSVVGLEEKSEDLQPYLYPNPNNGSFFFRSTLEEEYSIFNTIGEKVAQGRLEKGLNYIDPDIDNGIYFISINGSGKKYKIVVN